MADETGSPLATEAGQQPPGSQPEVVSTSAQGIVSTSAQSIVAVSTSGVQGSGSTAITNTTGSGVPGSILSVKQDALSGLLQSGLISTPQQVAALQQQLASLTVGGGMSVPLPPVNVTQVPLFKTTNDSSLFEMQTLLQSLPPPSTVPGMPANMDGVVGILRQIAGEHRTLMLSKRERDIEAKLKDVTNPMSRRSIEHDLRLLECVTNIKRCLTVGGNVLLATNFNLDLVNRSIMLVFSSIQEIEDRVKADHSKHLVAQKSVFGWKFVSSLEDLEKKCGHIDLVTLRSQEKAFAAHLAAVGGTSKWSDSDFVGESSSKLKGKNFSKNKKAKERKKAKGGKGKEHGVQGGKVGKSPKKGCHRCKGAHYVSECPKAPSTDQMTVD
jgi:hypothetical protein